MNRPSMVLVMRPCSALLLVSKPIEEYTATLASAKDMPMQVNSNSVVWKLGYSGINTQAPPTIANDSIIARR
jgi:hypothetical protein